MGKKRKRGASQQTKAGTDLGHKPFAKLAARKADAARSAEASRRKAAAEKRQVRQTVAAAEDQGRSVVGRAAALSGEAVEMTETELFERALAEIDAQKIVAGKYHGLGPETSHVRIKEEKKLAPAEIEQLDAPQDPYHDELALFEEAMGISDVAPIGAKLHSRDRVVQDVENDRANLRQSPVRLDAEARQAAIEAVMATAGPALRPSQKSLVRAVNKAERSRAVPEVNVRGDSRAVALRRVELSALQAAATGSRFVRVITGKGIGSEEEPVLKRALLEWCYGDGEGIVVEYAPEVQPDGTFGSFVLQVRRSRRR